MVYEEIKASTNKIAAVPASEYEWLLMHLSIRDFFIFTALKHGDKMMRVEGEWLVFFCLNSRLVENFRVAVDSYQAILTAIYALMAGDGLRYVDASTLMLW